MRVLFVDKNPDRIVDYMGFIEKVGPPTMDTEFAYSMMEVIEKIEGNPPFDIITFNPATIVGYSLGRFLADCDRKLLPGAVIIHCSHRQPAEEDRLGFLYRHFNQPLIYWLPFGTPQYVAILQRLLGPKEES